MADVAGIYACGCALLYVSVSVWSCLIVLSVMPAYRNKLNGWIIFPFESSLIVIVSFVPQVFTLLSTFTYVNAESFSKFQPSPKSNHPVSLFWCPLSVPRAEVMLSRSKI